MRLLQASSLAFEEFKGNDIPRYAILSHRWLRDMQQEVTFQDLEYGLGSHKEGYAKVRSCAQKALTDGLNYVWIDTCCIDQKSSAELSEAINSMYRWYHNAAVCYVYLMDVTMAATRRFSPLPGDAFYSSDWFLRGWTLQELIAPAQIKFYSRKWRQLGTKETLLGTLEAITGIPERVLTGSNLDELSIAQRMSWAAKRTTTRIEDRAYSLLGIFDINMPLLYGEGEKAFTRLQEEILKISNDQSIFAWSGDVNDIDPYVGLLAPTPTEFSGCGSIEYDNLWSFNEACQVNSNGLKLKLRLCHQSMDPSNAEQYIGFLGCSFNNDNDDGFFRTPAIFLQRAYKFKRNFQYVRVNAHLNYTLHDVLTDCANCQYETVFVRQNVRNLFSPRFFKLVSVNNNFDTFWIRTTSDIKIRHPIAPGLWYCSDTQILLMERFHTGILDVIYTIGGFPHFSMTLSLTTVDDVPLCSLAADSLGQLQYKPGPSKTYSQAFLFKSIDSVDKVWLTATSSSKMLAGRKVFVVTLFRKAS